MSHLRSFPLSRRFLLIDGAGRRARRVRALAGASDWRRTALDRLGSAAVAVAGTRPWPVSPGWAWPPVDDVQLIDRLRIALPGITLCAAAVPRQPERPRLSLLCQAGGHDVVVKLGVVGDGIETEALALRLLTDSPLPGIATPAVLASGILEGTTQITFLATSALGLEHQRPAIDEPLQTFERDLSQRLGDLTRPAGTPADAVVVHGDLAPWNLRRTGRGLALFDWEAAGWGAPGSDLAYYRRCCDELRR